MLKNLTIIYCYLSLQGAFLNNLQHLRLRSVYYGSRRSRYRSPFPPSTNSPQISGCFAKIPINKTKSLFCQKAVVILSKMGAWLFYQGVTWISWALCAQDFHVFYVLVQPCLALRAECSPSSVFQQEYSAWRSVIPEGQWKYGMCVVRELQMRFETWL